MTNKEYLEEAKKWQKHIRRLAGSTDDELYYKRSKVFDWLIGNAEKQVLKGEEK